MSELKDKAINIKGKNYVLVSDRVIYFNDNHPNGSIRTEVLSDLNSDVVVVKATVTPNMEFPDTVFTGHSQARWGDGMVNKTSALENAETSAVGRALGMVGIGVLDSIASADEMAKAGAIGDVFENRAKNISSGAVTEKCKKCGADMVTYQSGNVGCSKYCWKRESVAQGRGIN